MESFDFGKKKKKKFPVTEPKPTEITAQIDELRAEMSPPKPPPTNFTPGPRYDYQWLLERIALPKESTATVAKVRAPVVYPDGKHKTVWENFHATCKSANREPEHFMSFVLAELGTTGSIDGKNRFIIKGRFKLDQIQTIVREYITEYVKCRICKSSETILEKENRLTFAKCEKCHSRRSVAPIATGFRVTTRESRKNANS